MDLGQVSDSSEIDIIISQIFEEEKQAVIDAKERPETVNFLSREGDAENKRQSRSCQNT